MIDREKVAYCDKDGGCLICDRLFCEGKGRGSMTAEANLNVKKEIDGIINDCLHILVRMRQLEDRYGIRLHAEPALDELWENPDGHYTTMSGGATFLVWNGGQELADILDVAPDRRQIDKALGDRRFRFIYRDCIFTQLANGNAIFRKKYRRNNQYTRAELVNNPVDGSNKDVL